MVPRPGYRSYAYVLCSTFTPVDKIKAMAQLFVLRLGEYHNSPYFPDSTIMQNYWPLKKPESFYKGNVGLDTMVTDYDYARAASLLSAVGKTTASGPVLVAWKKSFETLTPDERTRCLVVDLSNFNNDDMDRQLQKWEDYLIRDITNSHDIYFMASRFSEDSRETFVKYGDYITNHLFKP